MCESIDNNVFFSSNSHNGSYRRSVPTRIHSVLVCKDGINECFISGCSVIGFRKTLYQSIIGIFEQGTIVEINVEIIRNYDRYIPIVFEEMLKLKIQVCKQIWRDI